LRAAVAQVRSRHWTFAEPGRAQGVWSRALGLPIERPKSVTMDLLEKMVAK